MNTLDDNICEQLSAWMDGELSKEEAKFLERRLQHDEALQAMYTRMQMTSASMKGQSARLMPNTLCANVRLAIAEETAQKQKTRKPLFAWAAAASMALAAVVFVPGMMQATNPTATEPKLAAVDAPAASQNTAATFASADLVANTPSAVSTSVVASSSTTSMQSNPLANPPAMETVAGVESPENFPLNISSEKKTWPRSAVNANSDPALEAYLVRHNQMMAQDGMGGFVPYVDVVAQDAEQANSSANPDGIPDEKAGDNK